MDQDMKAQRKSLLRLLLSQRLEMNAIESVLIRAGVLTAEYLKAIRTPAPDAAKACSADESDILTLLKARSLPTASTGVAPPEG
jgi:hypothetical protein